MAEEDLIFGKNRHFFGGIEPSNMKVFNVTIPGGTYGELGLLVVATLPDDTVVNDQTLCTVEGAIIRRKTTGYPKDEFDGDLVADIKESTSFTDTKASRTGTYYYAAFPYTTQGVYNRNKVNRVVVNEPEPMQEFSAKSVYVSASDTVKVEITAKLPSGVAGAVIRRSTTGYPTSETEGELFKNITANGTYTDTNVTVGVVYYYSAFPYTSTGAYNRSEANRTSVTPKKRDYLFGYDLVKATSSPTGRVTYPSDVDNAAFTPAAMNFSTGKFNYGGWAFDPGEKFMPRPCMLTYAGVVDHYLNPNDYTKKVNGTTSKVTDTSFGGNAMMEWPKIYTKRWESNGVYHFRCSDTPQDDTWDCWCNYDRNNNQIDHFYTPIYFGSLVSGKLRSISGSANSVNTTAANEIAYAKANGNDWYTEVLADRLLLQDLLVMMARSTECQTAFGYRPGEDDPHLKVLQAAHISDDEYFSHMVRDDLNLIIRDIREAHKKDSESAPQTTVADELKENLEAVENFKGSRDEKLVVLYCKQLGINYKNLSDEEFRWLIRILKKSKKMGTPISQRKKR